MVRRPTWLQHRGSRRILVGDMYEDCPEHGQFDRYRDWLIAKGGPPMRRAILKAADRYQALKPDQIRASALHRAYRSKR